MDTAGLSQGAIKLAEGRLNWPRKLSVTAVLSSTEIVTYGARREDGMSAV